mgnify:CR=1 FL=1
MARDGIPYLVLFAIPALVLGTVAAAFGHWWIWMLAALSALLAAFMAYFFRDPERTPPTEPNIVVSPADGKVLVVERVNPDDASSPTQVCIFLSPMDVHINRSPIEGMIQDVVYKPGEFRVASKRIASEVNEQNVITISNPTITIVARQIAGLLARRIVCWKGPGDSVGRGERIGLMKFSSRMDVVMTADIEVLCRPGDRVVAGESIIGRKLP